MSILYDYLKVLEKKRGKGIIDLQAPVQQRKSVTAPSYLVLAIGFVFFAGVLSLIFFFRNTKSNVPIVTEQIANSQQSRELAHQDSGSLNSNNAYSLDYSLSGIIYNSDSPSAVINGKLVEKNSKIDDWQVVEIFPSEVKLENTKNKSQLILKLNLAYGG